jgi:hypothetical protein
MNRPFEKAFSGNEKANRLYAAPRGAQLDRALPLWNVRLLL